MHFGSGQRTTGAPGVDDRVGGLVAIIVGDQFEPAAVNAAGLIGLGEGGENALADADAQGRGRPLKRRRLAEQKALSS